MKFAGDGVGDTNWKIPGEMDWATGWYDPEAHANGCGHQDSRLELERKAKKILDRVA
jgi:hypothetical protein